GCCWSACSCPTARCSSATSAGSCHARPGGHLKPPYPCHERTPSHASFAETGAVGGLLARGRVGPCRRRLFVRVVRLVWILRVGDGQVRAEGLRDPQKPR